MYNEAESSTGSKFRLQKFLLLLTQYWWVPAGTLFLSLIVAGVQLIHQPAVFFSVGSIWETMKIQLPDGPLFSENTESLPGTQNDLLRSGLMRDRALANLQAASNHVVIPVDSHGWPLPVTVRMSQTSKSAVVTLEAIGPQPAYTQAYLEALMQAYLEYKAELRKQISGDTLASIAEQVKLAELELKNQQDILTGFERTNNMAILQEEGTVAGGYLTKLKTQLSDLESAERLLETASVNLAETNPGVGQANPMSLDVETLTSLLGPQAAGVAVELQNKIRELDMLKMQRAALSVNLRDQHPKMKKMDADIETTERQLEIYRRLNQEQIAATAENARRNVENVQNSIKEWETSVVDVNSRIAKDEQLKNNMQRAQSEYDRLAALMQNFKISRDFDQETLAVLEHASPPARSYGAMKKTLTSTIMGGLLLGFGCVGLLTIRDEKFSSMVEVREKFGDSVLAQVPEWPKAEGKLQLTTDCELLHPYAESYRSLRSALLFFTQGANRPRVILITSAVPDEGKSTVSANLAHTLALGGSRVLLVDADMRRGTLHEIMHMEREPGLSHLLSYPADGDKIIQTNSLPNLSFISCGGRVINPGDLLLGPALDQLLGYWRSQFDYVLIDSCPVFAADDVTSLAVKVDGTLLVVRSRFSSERQVRGALEILHQRGARILGVVFNRVNASSRSYGHYNYAKYYDTADTAAS